MNTVPDLITGGPRLAQDYIHRFEAVSGFYGEDYRSEHGWEKRAAWLDESQHSRINRTALTACLRAYNVKHNDYSEVHKSLALLEQPETLVIVGGQQSGLFTGPVLVIYKAITIIQAAREAAARLSRPVVPVFWIAGEDHDWEEANHAYLLTGDLRTEKIKLDAPETPHPSVSSTPVSASQWNKAIEQMEVLLQDSEYKTEVLTMLRASASEADGLSDAFAKLMGRLFGSYGLILMDSADPELRQLEKPILESMIRNNRELSATYEETARHILEQGYEQQAEIHGNAANLFYLHAGRRLLLFRENGIFADRRGVISFTEKELMDELERHPERFSNNVLTRPLMQDSLLPVLAAVLGNGEIAYWGLLKSAFEQLGLRMPILLPRMSFTIVDRATQKYMSKYELTMEDVRLGLKEKQGVWLASRTELDLDEMFNKTKASFESLYTPLISELGVIEDGLTRLGETNKERILAEMDYLLSKSKEYAARRHEASLRQWDYIEVFLMPLGRLQERVYNACYYLNLYGFSWIGDMMSLPYESSGSHRVVYM